MLPNKLANESCDDYVSKEHIAKYRIGISEDTIPVCMGCGWEMEQDGISGLYTHVKHLIGGIKGAFEPVELTTRPDFIELVVSLILYSADGETLEKEYFTFIFRHKDLVSVTIAESGEASICYRKNEALFVHPDSVEDLLKFIKEG